MGDANDTKTKIEALKARLAPVAKAADLLAVARELEDLGSALAREEAAAEDAAVWPRDMNEPADRNLAQGDHSAEAARG